MSRHLHKKGLRTKIVLSLLVVGFIPVLVGLVITYWNGTLRLRESMGENFQGLAREASRKTDLVMEREIEGKKHLSITTEIREAIQASNQAYQGLSEQAIKERLAQLESRWTNGDPVLKEEILSKSTSIYLRNYMITKGQKYIAFFVTDARGAIVASVNGFPEYVHSQEVWWNETYNDGLGKIYISDLMFNEKAQVYAIHVAVPVIDEKEMKAIGILAVVHDVRMLLRPSIHDIRFGETGHAMLIDSDGRVLTCPVMPTGSFLEDKKLVSSVTSGVPGWVIAHNDGHGGTDSIIGFAPVAESSQITAISTGKRWHTFIRQDPKELYAPINSLLWSVSTSGILLIFFVAIMGVILSKKLAKPIQMLHEGAEEIGKGNLEVKLNIRTNDEIEQLANEFNQMAEKLKESYSTLEEKVAERTRQLSALNTIATTTNRSLDLQEILENTLDKILEVMQLEAGAIRLLDETGTKLVLRSSRGLPAEFIRTYEEISTAEMIAGQVVTTGRPVVIEDVLKTPHQSSPIFEEGFVSVVAIPLRSKDKILGTLTGASRNPRLYSSQDLELLASIGNQLSIAIDNATLYTKTKDMVAQLKEADRFKSEFFSVISHELRAPLTSIIGYSELLLDEVSGELKTKHGEYIANIQSSGTHLLELINNLLDLSKIKAGKMEIHFGEFSLRNLILNCIKSVAPLASKKAQNLRHRIEEGSLVINADEIKVRQIVLNLLSNAIKFTHHGGSITIEAHSSSLDNEPAVVLSVVDNGIGIKEGDLERIFEEFRQADSSYTREYSGSGLGLPIVKRFVEMHGGQVKVESQLGKGSRFTVILPKRIEPEKGVQERISQPEVLATDIPYRYRFDPVAADEPPRILVVEDDPQPRQILTNYLTSLGYQVEQTGLGQEAIEKAKTLKPFAITLDIMLPDQDGWEVLSTLKAMPETREIPVIIVSILENREMGLSLGAIDYLTKPINREQLAECLSRHGLVSKIKNRPITILLVDDDPVILTFIGDYLETERFGVIKAQTGTDAINLAARLRPDFIILDLLMPGMDGFEVIQHLKQNPVTAQIPTVILTHKELLPEERGFLRDKVITVIPKGRSLQEDLINEIRKVECLHPERAGLIDPLTQLYNERYFKSFLHQHAQKVSELRRAFSVMMTRIDHFRSYSEKIGRSEGNRVINALAKAFRGHVRRGDLICRCYGSTFGLAFAETVKPTAILIGNKMKNLGKEGLSTIMGNEMAGPFTLSVGVSTFLDDAQDVGSLIEHARQALDEAERQGGDCVVTA